MKLLRVLNMVGLFSVVLIALNLNNNVHAAGETGSAYVIKNNTLRCGYALWPPYLVKDPNTGELSGVIYDQMLEIGKFLDIKIEWTEETGYGNYIEGLKAGRYDMMCATVWPDGPRSKNTLLSIPALYSPVYAYTRAEDVDNIKSLNDLNTNTITFSAIDGDVTYSVAKTRFPNAKINALPQTSSSAELFLNVSTKKADVAIMDMGAFKDFEKHNAGKLKHVKALGPVGVFSESYSIPSGDVQLKNMIDTALIYLTNSGTTANIIKRYEGSLLAPKATYQNSY